MVRAASHGRASRFMTLKKSGQVELALCSATVRQEFAKLQETEGVCNNFKMLKNKPVSDLGSASSSQRPQGLDEERDFTYGPTGTQPVRCPECRRPFRLGDHPTPEQCPSCLCWFCCHVCRVKHNRRGWCVPDGSLDPHPNRRRDQVECRKLAARPCGMPRPPSPTWRTCPVRRDTGPFTLTCRRCGCCE